MAEPRRWFRFAPLPLENSSQFRASTLVLVLIGALAILHEEDWPNFGWLVIALTIFGYWLSYVRRGRPNWGLKIVIVGCMMWAMQSFFSELMTSANDPRIPLANLLLWLQTLHAFDLPYRHNLNVSFFVGVVLMAVGAVMSTTSAFAVPLVAFAAASLVMLQYSHLSWRAESVARSDIPAPTPAAPQPVVPRVRLAFTGRLLSTYLGLLVVASLIAYLSMPHLEGLRIRTLPISMVHGLPHMGAGGIVNPAYPNGVDPSTAARGGKVFDPENYNGFNNYLDLNVRGRLSDDIVMRVRSSRWTYYRALAFNQYDGKSWQITGEDLQKITSPQPPVIIEPAYPGSESLVQIFYLEKDMSNVVLGAYQINQVFFPGDTLYEDHYGGVRADFALAAGTTYSVISNVHPEVVADVLRRSRLTRVRHILEDGRPYLQLPPTLPPRVRTLAQQLTVGAVGPYEKAVRIATYLQQTYPYSLTTAAYPDGVDVCDQFLFETRSGACEQFATAMAVLCRASGVPARLVVGYLPGNFNPFSGVYEVKSSDAHSWVEIQVPFFGWLTMDPTPGGQLQPGIEVPNRNKWMIQTIVAYLRNTVHVPPALMRIAPGALAAARQAAPWVLGLGALLWGYRKRGRFRGLTWRATRSRLPGFGARTSGEGLPVEQHGIRREYQRMVTLLGRHHQHKKASQTPSEFARQVQHAAVDRITARFESLRYGQRSPTASDITQMRDDLRDLARSLRDAKRRPPRTRKSPSEPPARSTG